MPGITTHYLFGIKAWHRMEKCLLHSTISRFHGAYALGEQGPDPYFFHPIARIRKNGNPADIMHHEGLGLFLKALFQYTGDLPRGEKRSCTEAYAAGFLGHYELDSAVHPYVYGLSDPKASHDMNTLETHFFLENDLDTALLSQMKGMELKDFRMHATISMTSSMHRAVGEALTVACNSAYPDMQVSYFLMRTGITAERMALFLLEDKTCLKKKLAIWVEKLLFGHPIFSGIVGSKDPEISMEDPFNLRREGWINPWQTDKVRTESLPDLMKGAFDRYLRGLSMLNTYFSSTDRDRKERILNKLVAFVGNKSLHSGL